MGWKVVVSWEVESGNKENKRERNGGGKERNNKFKVEHIEGKNTILDVEKILSGGSLKV